VTDMDQGCRIGF